MRNSSVLPLPLIAFILFVPSVFDLPAVDAAEPAKFELLDGDRVVFLGNTLIEREQKYGYWELMLTMAWPERKVTFRNLGWSGDTVWGESRAGFGTQADGFKKLVEEVNAAKPTVIFVGYGNVEAFDGEMGLPKFIEGYNKLLDELEKTKARIILLGPIEQRLSLSPNPQAPTYNDSVRTYSTTLQGIAANRHLRFVNMFEATPESPDPRTQALNSAIEPTRSGNGMDVAELGYVGLGSVLLDGLGLRVEQLLTRPSAADLLDRIRRKNELFFHRWRPQNETYLFGFRKHEQGKNAQEVFAFDPLVAAEEKKIAELRVKLAAEMKETRDAK